MPPSEKLQRAQTQYIEAIAELFCTAVREAIFEAIAPPGRPALAAERGLDDAQLKSLRKGYKTRTDEYIASELRKKEVRIKIKSLFRPELQRALKKGYDAILFKQ